MDETISMPCCDTSVSPFQIQLRRAGNTAEIRAFGARTLQIVAGFDPAFTSGVFVGGDR